MLSIYGIISLLYIYSSVCLDKCAQIPVYRHGYFRLTESAFLNKKFIRGDIAGRPKDCYIKKKKISDLSKGSLVHLQKKKRKEESIDPDQTAQYAQSDLNRNFLFLVSIFFLSKDQTTSRFSRLSYKIAQLGRSRTHSSQLGRFRNHSSQLV